MNLLEQNEYGVISLLKISLNKRISTVSHVSIPYCLFVYLSTLFFFIALTMDSAHQSILMAQDYSAIILSEHVYTALAIGISSVFILVWLCRSIGNGFKTMAPVKSFIVNPPKGIDYIEMIFSK
jgi:hypothetical protein